MRAVDVGVGHDNDFMVAQTLDIEIFRRCRIPSAVIMVRISSLDQNPVHARFFDIENFASERQNRLKAAIASLFGRTAGRIALDNDISRTCSGRSANSRPVCPEARR